MQVINYRTQQYKLFPQLATAYANLFAGNKLMEAYEESKSRNNERKSATSTRGTHPQLSSIVYVLVSINAPVNMLLDKCPFTIVGLSF